MSILRSRSPLHHTSIGQSRAGLLAACLAFGSVTLASRQSDAKPWKSAEVISHQTFKFGAFEARIRAARGSGMITPFFLWKHNSEIPGVRWQEQDFEIFGSDGRFQTQLITPDTGWERRKQHLQFHTLLAPAWERYYTYRMEWTPTQVSFYIDGHLLRREDDRKEFSIFLNPDEAEPAQLRFGLWAGNSDWSGAFDAAATPAATFFDWIQVYDYTPQAGPDGSDFTPAWRDDFDTFNFGRWWTANWTFDFAVNDYVPENVTARDGKLIIVLTDQSRVGQFPAPPEDRP